MDEIKTSEAIVRQRRRFFGAAALTIAAAEFGMIGFRGCPGRPGKPLACFSNEPQRDDLTDHQAREI